MASARRGILRDHAELAGLARVHTPDALAALVVVMNDPAAPAAARVSAANALLDRGHGKSRQALEHGGNGGGPIVIYMDEMMTDEDKVAALRTVIDETQRLGTLALKSGLDSVASLCDGQGQGSAIDGLTDNASRRRGRRALEFDDSH